MQHYLVKRQVYDCVIQAHITQMPEDIHILLIGGCLPHIGAVSIFEKGNPCSLVQLPGHKDGIVSQRWAKELSSIFENRVTVNCGIHYDQVTKDMIQEVVRITEEMLKEVINVLR